MIPSARLLPFLVVLLAIAGCSEETRSQSDEPTGKATQVAVAEVREWNDQSVQELPGVVRPGKRAVLSTRVAGTLESVTGSPGDQIATGDLLATVDAREIEAAIAAAEEKIDAASAAVSQARLDSERLQRLYEEDLIARVRVERAGVKLSELEAQQQSALAQLEAQQATLSYTRLTAPFDGVVSEILVDSGSFVGPGQPLLVVEERQTMRVDVPVSRNQVHALTPGQTLTVETGPEEQRLDATLVGVVPALSDSGTGQRLRLSVKSETGHLAPGEVVTVLVPIDDPAGLRGEVNWVGLPTEALIRRGQLTGVMVVESADEKADGDLSAIHLRWIETANGEPGPGNLIPVTRGLEPGEKVVLNPSLDLRNGQLVKIDDTEAGHEDR